MELPKPWRAIHTFQVTLFVAFVIFIGAVLWALGAYLLHGELTRADTQQLLAVLYIGCYPNLFVALVSLFIHFIKSYRGDYAVNY